MAIKRFLGWMSLAAGIVLMIKPFLSGLTGYFVSTSLSILPTLPNFELAYSIIGLLLAVFGYYLIRPKKEGILS